MTTSEEFQRYKELYYEEDLPVIDVSHQDSQVIITFKDGDSDIQVSGTCDDFTNLTLKLVPTIRNGIEQLIEVSEISVDSSFEYYENMRYFAAESNNPIDEATKQLRAGKAEIPEEIDWREALQSTLRKDINNPDLKKVVKNYYETLAVVRSDKYEIESIYAKIRSNNPYNESIFYKYYTQAITILENRYISLNPLKSYKEFIETCETDVEYLSSNLMLIQKQTDTNWEALQNREPDDEEDLMFFRKKQRKKEDISNKVGKIELDIGIQKILDQYSDIFELSREPLRDIAVTLDKRNRDLSGTNKVLSFLESNEAQSFPEAVEPQMRHGSAHNQIGFNEEENSVEFYDGRGKARDLITRKSYEEILQRYYELHDMIIAVLLAFSKIWYFINYRYLGSKEFQYRVLEQMDSNF